MYKVGLSSCGFDLTAGNFEALQRSGIVAVEISMGAAEYTVMDYRQVEKLARQNGITLWSFHLPFMPFDKIDLSAMEKSVREDTLGYFSELIRKGAGIGIDKFVVHPSAEPIETAQREDRMKYAMESLDRLAEIAGSAGAVIAVEDLPRTCLGNCIAEIRRLISANDALRVCFDTNHLLFDDNAEFVRQLGDKIVTVHISDYDFVNERHWLPGEGKVAWAELMDAFAASPYDGVWMYELGQACPKTIQRSRDLTFSDFADNAQSLFRRQKPMVFSTPKPNLGMWE